ncbi:hypothetical protein ASD24_24660 [Paenibacillus sp. Root52]|uniref:hypothetical protein n=1 Tax=Paenibacillus sp. Root52 TaxID=1736552 RepID=UPI0006FE2FB2|nr:hypothetical protein [Paenibacillus sp. Root52]KQY90991.1 hypothetical protein ASD24_24660 [Paenibacillus sp. Root52]
MKNKHKKKRKSSLQWKKGLIGTLVLALIFGSISFSELSSKVNAAEHAKIVGFESYDYRNGLDTSGGNSGEHIAILDNGSRFSLPRYEAIPLNFFDSSVIKQRRSSSKESSKDDLYSVELKNNGELYIKEGSSGAPKKVLDDVVDFEMLASQYRLSDVSFYVLMRDNSVMAFGKGSGGELGIGYRQDKNVPTEVVDPATGDPITNVRKLFQLGTDQHANKGVLLVTDTDVYLIGKAFGQNSFLVNKPVKLDMFPSFTDANFDLKFMDNVVGNVQAVELYGTAVKYSSTERLIFTISGNEYTLTSLMEADKNFSYRTPYSELTKTTLIPVPDGIKTSELVKSSFYNYSQRSLSESQNVASTGYGKLSNGEFSYWGTTPSTWGSIDTVFDPQIKTIATGVKSVVQAAGDFFYLRNNNVFAFGPNISNSLGVGGGVQTDPIRITGSNNEVKNIKELVAAGGTKYALTHDMNLISWSNDKNFNTSDRKFQTIFTIKRNFTHLSSAYGIGEDNKLYLLRGSNAPYEIGAGILPSLVAQDYVEPIVAPGIPQLSIVALDKFNQPLVNVDFGSFADIATKQYQVNSGGWKDYTGDILITQTGSVTVQARSADSKGNISEVGELTLTSNPIVITAGQPLLNKVSGDEFKVSADATGVIKVQVKVDGGAWQDFNVANNLLLTPGAHTVEVRLLNERDQELINKSFNVTADSSAPGTITKPQINQYLSEQFELNLQVVYNESEGEIMTSIDGDVWHKNRSSLIVSNHAHTIRAKIVSSDGTESETTEFVTTQIQPLINVANNEVTIDPGVQLRNVTLFYKDPNNNEWLQYFAPFTAQPGTHDIEVEIRDMAGYGASWHGGPYSITIADPNAGNGGGNTPTPSPGNEVPVGKEDVDFTVLSGGLSARFEGADLSTIIIDSTNPYQSINSVSRALIEDSRGNGKGYQYSMDVTDFVSDPMQDNSLNKQSLIVSIPANSLSVNVGHTKTLNGPAAELANVGKHVFTGNGPELLARAQAFEGMGYVEIPLDFTLSVPDRVKVVSSDSGSKFVPGELTGLMAGIYRSTIRSTLTSGI